MIFLRIASFFFIASGLGFFLCLAIQITQEQIQPIIAIISLVMSTIGLSLASMVDEISHRRGHERAYRNAKKNQIREDSGSVITKKYLRRSHGKKM